MRLAAPDRRVQGALFWLMAGLVLVAPLWLGANRPVAWTGLSIALLALLAAQIMLDTRSPSAGALWRGAWPFVVPYLALLGWAVVQAAPTPVAGWAHPAWVGIGVTGAISADPAASWQGVMRLAGYGAVFWIAARAMGVPNRASRFVDALAVLAVALAIYGIGAVVLATNPLTGPSAYPGAVTSSFVNRNAYALYGGIGAMACLAALAQRLPGGGGRKADLLDAIEAIEAIAGPGWIWFAGMLIVLGAVFLTGSRAGSLAAVLGLVSAIVLTARGAGRIIGAAALAPPVAVLIWNSDLLTGRLADGAALENKRIALYGQMIDAALAAPWRGHGLGAFQDAFRAYMPAGFSGADWDLGHNSYLENAVELGLPAAAALVLALAAIGRQIAQGLSRRRSMRPVVAFGLAVLIAGAAHAAVDFSLQMPATAALFALILGMAWGLARREVRREEPQHRTSALDSSACSDDLVGGRVVDE